MQKMQAGSKNPASGPDLLLAAVALVEFVYAAGFGHHFLLCVVKGMVFGIYLRTINAIAGFHRAAGHYLCAIAHYNFNFIVFGMYVFFHGNTGISFAY